MKRGTFLRRMASAVIGVGLLGEELFARAPKIIAEPVPVESGQLRWLGDIVKQIYVDGFVPHAHFRGTAPGGLVSGIYINGESLEGFINTAHQEAQSR